MTTFAERLATVEERIARACRAARRERREVTLVAVSKEQPDEAVRALHALGVRDFGENKVQALAGRCDRLRDLGDIRWHLIGPIQTNKAKDVVRLAPSLVHTVDRPELVSALGRRLETGSALECLVQVNIDREPQKAGVAPEELPALLDAIAEVAALRCRGLMAIPRPLSEVGEGALGASFSALRELLEAVRGRLSGGAAILSLGMSDDFPLAIAHGATLVRVGTAVFGPRPARA